MGREVSGTRSSRLAGVATLNPFERERCTLWTQLDPTECMRRLRAHTRPRAWESKFTPPEAERPVRGDVTQQGFMIVKHVSSIRSFQIWATGSITPVATGARIDITLSMHPLVQIFQAFILAFLALLLLTVVAVAMLRADVAQFVGAWPLLMVAAFILAILWLGHWLARGDRNFLTAFLKSTLDASENI